jgi:hypothetical protein
MDSTDLVTSLEAKAQRLTQHVWPRDLTLRDIDRWVANFPSAVPYTAEDVIRRHCLYVLTHIVAFRPREFAALVRALFREYIRLPVVYEVREALGLTASPSVVQSEVRTRLASTVFVGLGAAAKSGSRLMYDFQKESHLPRQQLVDSCDDLLTHDPNDPKVERRHPAATRYVILDDMCGTGESARDQLPVVRRLRQLALAAGSAVTVELLFLFAIDRSLPLLKGAGQYDDARALMRFTASHRVFDPESRYFRSQPAVANGLVTRETAEEIFRAAGGRLCPAHPLGYGDGQLLLAFDYNTPDNTLTAIWSSGPDEQWFPLFPRRP